MVSEMKKQSLGQTIEQMRKKTSSLGQLEIKTGKDRSSIRRYERGEVPPPLDVAEKMAATFYKNSRDRALFLQRCREALKIDNKEAKAGRKRKKELTAAARKYTCEIRLEPLISRALTTLQLPDGETMQVSPTFFDKLADQKIKYERIEIEVLIRRTKDREPILRISLGKPLRKVIWHKEGKSGYFTEETLDLKKYLMLCNRLKPKVGPHALPDLAKETVEKSDILNPETYQRANSKKVKGVWVDEETLEGFLGAFEFIQEIVKESKNKREIESNITFWQALGSAIALVKYQKSRIKELGKFRSKLLYQIESLCQEITQLKQSA